MTAPTSVVSCVAIPPVFRRRFLKGSYFGTAGRLVILQLIFEENEVNEELETQLRVSRKDKTRSKVPGPTSPPLLFCNQNQATPHPCHPLPHDIYKAALSGRRIQQTNNEPNFRVHARPSIQTTLPYITKYALNLSPKLP